MYPYWEQVCEDLSFLPFFSIDKQTAEVLAQSWELIVYGTDPMVTDLVWLSQGIQLLSQTLD